MRIIRRALSAARNNALDGLAVAGLALIAFGLGQAPEPWGGVLGPVALGIGLVAAVRYGTR